MSLFLDYGDGRSGSATGVSGVINSYATCTATAGSRTVTTSLSVSVGDMVFLWQTLGTGATNCEMVRVSATGGGSFTTTIAVANTYASGAQAVKVPQYTSGTFGSVSATAYSTGTSVGGLCIMVANGPVSLATGAVNLDALGFLGGAGASAGPNTNATGNQGVGTGGSGGQSNSANGNGGGGGGVTGSVGSSKRAGGGGGANASTGTNGSSTEGGNVGVGGSAAGSTTTLSLGGGGGQGGGYDSQVAGNGGAGGGNLVVFAPSITVTAPVTCTATAGAGGGAGGGGGGSGGNVYLGGQTIVLGSSVISAKGAAGGVTVPGNGGAGSDGRIYAFAPVSTAVTGTTDPTYTFVTNTSFAPKAQGFII